jgi:dienelactone hydrolase
MIRKALFAGALFAVTTAASAQDRRPMDAATYNVATSLFAYDAKLPFNPHVIAHKDTVGFVRDKIAINGWRGSRVPFLLAIPKDSAAEHPLIVLLDGIGGWKERWWVAESWNRGRVLIDSLLASGYAVVTADMPSSGERTYENDFETSESFIGKMPQWQDFGVQNTIEVMRLLDFLQTRPEIDASRFGALGLSHGGMMTYILSALDPRIRVAVAGLAPQQKIPDVLLPLNYAPHITIPFLMLAGRKDSWYTEAQVEQTRNALGSKEKQLVWYDVGHRLPPEYAGAAVAWFRKYLR